MILINHIAINDNKFEAIEVPFKEADLINIYLRSMRYLWSVNIVMTTTSVMINKERIGEIMSIITNNLECQPIWGQMSRELYKFINDEISKYDNTSEQN